MPLGKYLNFLEAMTGDALSPRMIQPPPRPRVYARVDCRQGRLRFCVDDSRLLKTYPAPDAGDNKCICSLHWINTRNRFSGHLVRALLDAQQAFWISGCEADLKPLSYTEFLCRYPLPHLEVSRLSRLIGSTRVCTPQRETIGLKRLFPSRRKIAAYRIKQWVQRAPCRWSDRDLQVELARQGLSTSLRSVIYSRKLLHIPSQRQRLRVCYGSQTPFGLPVPLGEKRFSRFPSEPGVYELRLPVNIGYTRGQSEVFYIGCSRDLRRRISSYSSTNQKNRWLRTMIRGQQVFVRFCPTRRYRALENELLAQFRDHFGALPKANTLGGNL